MPFDLRVTLQDAFRRGGSVSNRQLQSALQLSRQSVWKRLRPLLDSGELRAVGFGRGQRYVPGPGFWSAEGLVRAAPNSQPFWSALAKHAPKLAYLSVATGAAGTRTAHQARALLNNLEWNRFIVLDFARIQTVSDAFAEALGKELANHFFSTLSVFINATPEIVLRIDRARRRAAERLAYLDQLKSLEGAEPLDAPERFTNLEGLERSDRAEPAPGS